MTTVKAKKSTGQGVVSTMLHPAPLNGGVEQETSADIDHEDQFTMFLEALRAAKDGDFAVRLPAGPGLPGRVAQSFNELIAMNEAIANEIIRVSKAVAEEGMLGERVILHGNGAWMTKVDGLNALISSLAQPTFEVGRVISAVAEGDLTKTMALEIEGRTLKGEFQRIGTRVNTMVDQLSSFAAEVTRVAREVGTDGKLGGQAVVQGVGGTWKDLTDNVNAMAANLTSQVRNIAEVTTAVAQGDLSKKITVAAKGEIEELKSTINIMVDQLGSFAAEVTRVAREVGTDGKLGGQAEVKGVGGTWKDLPDNVNGMAANLLAPPGPAFPTAESPINSLVAASAAPIISCGDARRTHYAP
jgi:HAMP domain-containing protein